jgi:hypothetical protein
MFSSNTSQTSGGYEIQRSLRFNGPDSAYLNRTPGSASSRKTWTWSGWVKRGIVGSGTQEVFIGSTSTGGNSIFTGIRFIDDNFYIQDVTQGTYNIWWSTSAVYRDPAAWYHIVVKYDTTQSSSSNAATLWVNGVQQILTFTANTGAYVQNRDGFINATNNHYIGASLQSSGSGTQNYYNGYMTEVNFIDGQALTPSSFGAFDAQTGVWGPTRYGGSYGTNGFYLNFSDNSNTTAATLGKDYSPNGNNWTPNNFSVSAGAGNDSLVDVPTNWGTDTGVGGSVRGNYCTLNPLVVNYATLTYSNGNLEGAATGGDWSGMQGTLSVSTGKWYWEVTHTSADNIFIGIARTTMNFATINPQNVSGSIVYFATDGNKRVDGTNSAYGASFTVGDVIGVALDLDANTVTFYKNNASQGAISLASTTLSGIPIVPLNAVAVSPTKAICNFGQRPFAYTAPSGFKALTTQNLPTPTIGATTATQAGKFFDVVLRNGGAPSGGTYSTTVNMANGALLWDKPRNSVSSNYLVDSVRGISKNLRSNTTDAESTDVSWFTGFNNGSFTTGSSDWGSSTTVVDWIWAANGAGVTNTAGSVTTTVSANTTSGFSIARGTLPSSGGASYGHGLGVAPSFIFAKCTSTTSDWFVYHSSLGFNQDIRLNTASSASSTTFTYNSASASTVTIGGGNVSAFWGANTTWVWYNFAEVPGYSRFGNYTGNGVADGPFVFTGFRPAYVMIKNASLASAWIVYDNKRNTANAETNYLLPNSSGAEATLSSLVLDFTSNGFKIRGDQATINTSNNNYIYACFAESPQKFSLAR